MHACASGCPTKEASGGWPSLEDEGGKRLGPGSGLASFGWRWRRHLLLRGRLGGLATPLKCGVHRAAHGQLTTFHLGPTNEGWPYEGPLST
jgi:hypothetical protein